MPPVTPHFTQKHIPKTNRPIGPIGPRQPIMPITKPLFPQKKPIDPVMTGPPKCRRCGKGDMIPKPSICLSCGGKGWKLSHPNASLAAKKPCDKCKGSGKDSKHMVLRCSNGCAR